MSRSISTFIKAELSKLSHIERSRMICELQRIIDQESFDLAAKDSKEPNMNRILSRAKFG